MSLNCLTCQALRRIDSDKELREGLLVETRHFMSALRSKVERSWSGNLVPKPYHKTRNDDHHVEETGAAAKTGHHRVHSVSGPASYGGGPRLVRSCGMRRDWSFENLRQRRGMK
ncbi:hypothetical protein U1Q18_021522 [Sarracenia purpurea var. burkii]